MLGIRCGGVKLLCCGKNKNNQPAAAIDVLPRPMRIATMPQAMTSEPTQTSVALPRHAA